MMALVPSLVILLALVGVFIYVLYRGLQQDTVDYDLKYLWDFYHYKKEDLYK